MNNTTFGLLVVTIMIVIALTSEYLKRKGIITMIPLMITMVKEANGSDLTSKFKDATATLQQLNELTFTHNETYMNVINKTLTYYYIILGTIEAILGYFAITNLMM